ncbi:MAG TPA: preprotein translocase subunit SecG [Arenimonas sp.]|nr:preprotein translocase subunit SecG [Arenimonas sp.]
MLLTIVSVIYVLVAIAMIVLILMQRGSGAAAGSGFGGGASATVFGARGSSNFLSTATKWLAALFMGLSLGMAWYATHGGKPVQSLEDIGAMSEVPGEAAPAGELPTSEVPGSETPASEVPAAELPTDAAVPAADAAPAEVPEAGDAASTAGDDAENNRGG